MVSKIDQRARAVNPNVGRQILDIITSGMYNNPLMVIREYIQNAADSIDEGESRKLNPICADDANIYITISGQVREITIFDTGAGICNKKAEERLGSLGFSNKEGSNRRGFRGIGRLGGLGYCNLLRFETRSHSKEKVAVVEWNGEKLKELAVDSNKRYSLEETIRKIASIKMRQAESGEPKHFFKVTMVGVNRFHTDVLMNIKKTRTYLSQVAPVPYNDNTEFFAFGRELHEFFSEIPNYRTYNIFVNGERVYKPYRNEININSNQKDCINDITKLTFTNPETDDIVGLGWFARTSFKSSLPKSVTMRGIRVRHGNIEVGNEYFLGHIFSEKRFATWHIGEIHLNHGIKPNARRDGFEENTDYERFLERAFQIGKGLSKLCRDSSLQRSANQRVMAEVIKVEEVTCSSRLVINKKHHTTILDDANKKLEAMSKLIESRQLDAPLVKRIEKLKKRLITIETN
ncbi:MAG: ATP-binding protein, partial [Anaerohalosphaera sp.]|nr:ATP-binding protein [Anaerohalosphaera sp.]